MNIGDLLGQYRSGTLTPRGMIDDVLARLAANGDSNSWLHLLERDELYRYADRLATLAPDSLPLYGIPFAIKDNIDLAGAPTTAACPAYRYLPERSAFVVQRLIAAGAIPIGKTNLDQFATGLVGTRSPHGTPRNPYHADYIPGGSSSGSAAAVAAGEVAFALGTDTAGSGRVPAAFTNLFGIKPTRGLLSTAGVVPACRSLDCVSIFARDAADSRRVLAAAAGYDPADPWSRREAPLAERAGQWPFVFGVPRPEQLRFFGNSEYERLFGAAVARLEDLGGYKREIDFEPFAAAARLLYEGPWVAERYAALAEFITRHPKEFFPVTYEIIAGGTAASAVDAFRGMYRLQELRRRSETVWAEIDCLVTPTAGTIYRIAEVVADPLRLNANLGYYTNFMNLLDLAALAVPAGFTAAGLPFGITLAAPTFGDYRLLQLGERFAAAADAPLEIAVCGAHMRGLPLNRQLVELGGRFLRADRTAPAYRLFALATDPPKPGLLRSAAGGAAIELEVWQLPAAGLGRFLAAIPAPLGLGKVELADGRQVTGFLVEAAAVADAREITACGSWRRFIS